MEPQDYINLANSLNEVGYGGDSWPTTRDCHGLMMAWEAGKGYTIYDNPDVFQRKLKYRLQKL